MGGGGGGRMNIEQNKVPNRYTHSTRCTVAFFGDI